MAVAKRMVALLVVFALAICATCGIAFSAWAGDGDAELASEPNYLTFMAQEENSSVTFNWYSGSDVQCSLDGGASWDGYDNGAEILLSHVGDTVSFRGYGVATDGNKHFTMTGGIAGSGSVTSLTDGIGNDSNVRLSTGCYKSMFYGCASLTSAPSLPAIDLANDCYLAMFHGCTSLTEAPQLPATTLASSCYEGMFANCTSLTIAPQLPATALASACYDSMFINCTSLTEAPELPATTLASSCYQNMFYGCSSLAFASSLPATSLADWCYAGMFRFCTSLSVAPVLPAVFLSYACYSNMFEGCVLLKAAPALPATTLAEYCYSYMFNDCVSLSSIPDLSHVAALAKFCCRNMFSRCITLRVSEQPGDGLSVWQMSNAVPADNWGPDIFRETSGTFTGTPCLNTTYYVSGVTEVSDKEDPLVCYPIDSVIMEYDGGSNLGSYDVLERVQTVYSSQDASRSFTLTPKLASGAVSTWKVMQPNACFESGLPTDPAWFTEVASSTGKSIALDSCQLEAGGEVYLIGYDAKGRVCASEQLNITVKHDKFDDVPAEFSIGEDFSYTVGSGVFAGVELKIDEEVFPVTAEYTSDGTVLLKVNIYESGGDDDDEGLIASMRDGSFAKKWTSGNIAKRMAKTASDQASEGLHPKLEVIGYLEGAMGEDGGVDELKGKLYVKVSAKGGFESQVWELPPAVLGVSYGVGADGSASLGYDFGEGDFTGDLAAKLKGGLGVYFGAGLANVVSLGVEGKADLNLECTLLSSTDSAGLDKAYLYGALSVLGKLLGKDLFAVKVCDGYLYLYDRGELAGAVPADEADACAALAAAVGALDPEGVYEPVARGYLGAGDAALAASAGAAGSGSVIDSAAYPETELTTVSCGEGRMLLYLADCGDGCDSNRTRLMYSVYDPVSGVWGEPAAVDDDGTADFGPAAYEAGGKVYIAWQDASSALSDDMTLAETAAAMDVSFSVYDEATGAFTAAESLTSGNSDYESSLSVSAGADGSPLVAWRSLPSSDPTGTGGSAATVRLVASGGGGWATVAQETAQGLVSSVVAACLGQGPCVAWSSDSDGDASTADDGAVWLADGSSAGAIAEGEVGSSFAALYGGSQAVGWYSAGGIACTTDGSSVTALGVQGLPAAALRAGGDLSGDGVAYALVSEGGATNLVGARCSGGQWGAVGSLTSQDGVIGYASAYPAGGEVGIVYSATAQGSSESGAQVVSVIGSGGDASVTEVAFDADAVEAGGCFTATAVIANGSASALSGATLRVADSSGGDVAEVALGDVPAGGTAEAQVAVPVPEDAQGAQAFSAYVAGSDGAASDPYAFEVGAAMLSIDAEHVLESGCESVAVTVGNMGLAPADAAVTATGEDGAVLWSADLGSVDGKGSASAVYRPGEGTLADAGVSGVVTFTLTSATAGAVGGADTASVLAWTDDSLDIEDPSALDGEAAAPESGDLNSGIAMSGILFQLPSAADADGSADGSVDIRISCGIDDLDYESAGFLFSAVASDEDLVLGAAGVSGYESRYAYPKVSSGSYSIKADSLFGQGYDYALALKVTGVPLSLLDGSLKVRAYVVKGDGTVVYSEVRSLDASE